MKRLGLLFFFIAALLLGADAQYFQTGEDPAGIRWRQLQTHNFQVIYPDYFEQQAQILAGKLEAVYTFGSYSLGHQPRKISVILHTQTVKSNGLVGWAPRRAEFYTTPHPSIYPQEWLEQLAIHEFRHVVQVDKLNSQLPLLIKAILGEQGTALVFGSYFPWWFIEGDAVVMETALSNYGRGRFPSFLMEHKAQVVEKQVFSYDKASFGSYRDFVPDHYKLGYYLVGNARERYGHRLWERVLEHAGKYPVSLAPMNNRLKKYTGFNKQELYRSVFDSLQSVWKKEDSLFEPVPFKVISPPGKYFKNYIYNYWINDSMLVSYKKSYAAIPSFVKQTSAGQEEKILSPGIIFEESASGRGVWMAWSEQIPDPRWEHSGKSLLRFYNTQTERMVEFVPEYKCFSPVISPGKKKVAVVESDFSNNHFLSVYKLPEGTLLNRIQTPDNNYFFSPAWLDNDQLMAVMLTDKGKRLAEADLQSGNVRVIFEKEMGDLKQLRVAGNKLYFISSYSGKNSLYRMDLNDHKVSRIFEPRFDVAYPAISPDGSTIVLSDYTAGGFRLIRISARPQKVAPLDSIEQGTYPLAEALAEQEMGIPGFSDRSSVNFPSKNYRKPAHLINFHSWAPLSIDAGAYEITPGASLMSQNKLGTAETVLGYQWDISEKAGHFYADYSFRGWYPVFNFRVTSGKKRSEITRINQMVNNQGEVIRRDTVRQRFSWGKTQGNVNVNLPLNFDKGFYHRHLQPEIHYSYTRYNRHASTPEDFNSGDFHSVGYRLYYHQLLRKSYLDVYPDFGFVLDAAYRHEAGGSLSPGNIASAEAVLYLPGLLSTHGIKFYGGTQQTKNNGTLGFSDIIKYPRGWERIRTTRLSTATADYKLPLLYPDVNLGRWIYCRRMKASLFGDYARLEGNIYREGTIADTYQTTISSVGAEITADVNLLRFYAPVEIGVRTSYLPRVKDVFFDFLFSVNFNAL